MVDSIETVVVVDVILVVLFKAVSDLAIVGAIDVFVEVIYTVAGAFVICLVVFIVHVFATVINVDEGNVVASIAFFSLFSLLSRLCRFSRSSFIVAGVSAVVESFAEFQFQCQSLFPTGHAGWFNNMALAL